MKIRNYTKWQTKQIAAFVRRVSLEEFPPERMKHLVVEVKYTRGGPHHSYNSGFAYYNKNFIRLNVSAHHVDRIDLAHVIAHEMGHCRGLKHGAAMNSSRYRRVGNWRERYAWAETLPLEEQPVKKKLRLVGAVADERKLTTAREKVTEWDRKIKAANTRRKTWWRKVKYYEAKLKKAATSGG